MSASSSMQGSRRWLRRIAWNLLLLALLLLVLGMLAVLNLTPLSLWAANRFLPAWRFHASRVTVEARGALTIRELSVQLRRDGGEVLSVRKARAAFSWRELFKSRLFAVDLDGFRVVANDGALEEVQTILAGKSSIQPRWQIDRLTVKNGSAKVALAEQSEFDSRFDFKIFSLGEKSPAGKADTLRLRNFSLRSPTGRDIVAIPDATLAFAVPEIPAGHFRKISLESPRVSLNADDLGFLKAPSPAAEAGTVWKLDSLAINDASIRVDIPSLPLIEGNFAIHAADLGSDPKGPQTPGEVLIKDVVARPRDSTATPATLKGATVQFTGPGLLAGHLAEVRLDAPSVTLNEAWKTVFALRAGDSPLAPSASPLQVDHLVLDGGKADIVLPGVPAIRGLLAAEFSHLGAGDAAMQRIEMKDLQVGLPDQPAGTFHEWLTLPSVKVSFNVDDLVARHRLKSIELDGATLHFDRECRGMFSKVGDAATVPADPFVAEQVRFRNSRVALDDLGIGVPPLDFSLNLDLSNVPINDPLSGDTAEIQKLELSNINFVSPLDPFVPVLSLHSVFVRWTPLGLRDRKIEEITVVSPEINIGPDLFWYFDLVAKHRAEADAAASAAQPGPSWRVKRFDATSGKLTLALAGQTRITLPMPFESHAENVDFQRLSDARLSLVLEVPPQDYDNSTLDIHLHGVSGRIDFQLPPGANAENVVQTLKARDVRWKDFRGGDWWLGLTFDEMGVHGDGGGKMCSGEVRAAFTYFLDPSAPWTGWISGTRLDLKELTDKLATGRASMTGRASLSLAVNGVGSDVTRIAGHFRAPGGGKLRITKLDDLLAAIPSDWEATKRDLMRIGIESLRDYPYDSGNASFWLTQPVGQFHVRLDGTLGKRELDVNFNPPGDLNRLFLFSPFKP